MPLAATTPLAGALEYLLLAFVSLFAIVGPLSIVPVFLAMTPNDPPPARIAMARRACWVAGSVLAAFALTGQAIFSFMGISLPAFQIAGGVLVFFIALEMLRAKESETKVTPEEQSAGEAKENIAITPLAVPLLAGPGSISTTIILKNQATTIWQDVALFAAIVLVALATFFIFRISATGASWLSPLVLRITRRIMGLLLAAIAVQFVLNGLVSAGIIDPLPAAHAPAKPAARIVERWLPDRS